MLGLSLLAGLQLLYFHLSGNSATMILPKSVVMDVKQQEMTNKKDSAVETAAQAAVTEAKQVACKTLWFAGFYDGFDRVNEYARFYSNALLSAPDLFQPILLVGHQNEEQHNVSQEIKEAKGKFYAFAEEHGASSFTGKVFRLHTSSAHSFLGAMKLKVFSSDWTSHL